MSAGTPAGPGTAGAAGGLPPLLVLVGPTAAGKSEVALGVAERLRVEIVSGDSMQVYRGMDVGTAKPTPWERAAVPHHLLDLVQPVEPFSVAAFKEEADRCIRDVHHRGHLPFLVGGSGLYIRAVVENYDLAPDEADPSIRDRWRRVAQREGTAALHRKLEEVDPAAAARIHPNDLRRLVRALEVYERTGHPISEAVERTEARGRQYDVLQVGLTWTREELYRRIDLRVERMLAAGLVAEVQRLGAAGFGRVARQALGYKEILPHLSGEMSLEAAVSTLKQDTRRFAKRQLTWFRAQRDIHWVETDSAGWPGAVVAKIVRLVAEKWPGMYNRE